MFYSLVLLSASTGMLTVHYCVPPHCTDFTDKFFWFGEHNYHYFILLLLLLLYMLYLLPCHSEIKIIKITILDVAYSLLARRRFILQLLECGSSCDRCNTMDEQTKVTNTKISRKVLGACGCRCPFSNDIFHQYFVATGQGMPDMHRNSFAIRRMSTWIESYL